MVADENRSIVKKQSASVDIVAFVHSGAGPGRLLRLVLKEFYETRCERRG